MLNGNTLTVGSANNLNSTFSGVIADGSASGSLIKGGTGNFTLAGNNTYSGGTTLSAGTLTATTATLPSATGVNGNGSPAILNFNQATNGNYVGTISGLAAVATSGTGTVALTASNNYSGGTFVNAGELVAANPYALGTGTVTVSGGTLGLTAYGSVNNFGVSGGSSGNSLWAVNNSSGTVSFPAVAADTLTLTTNATTEGRSALYTAKINPSAGFTANFIYRVPSYTGSTNPADGMAFVLAAGTTATVGTGNTLGYNGFSANSAAVEFNLYPNYNPGAAGTSGTYFDTNGAVPATYTATGPTGGTVNIASGDPISVTLTYSASAQTLTENLLDLTTAASWSNTFTGVNILTTVGTSAYVGFTGATGGSWANQTISNFSMVNAAGVSTASVGNYANAIAVPANSSQTVTVGALVGSVAASGTNITASGGMVMGVSSTLNVAADPTATLNQGYSLRIGNAAATVSVSGAATFNVANNGTGAGNLQLTLINDGGSPATININTNGSGSVSLQGTGSITLGTQYYVNAGTLNVSDGNGLGAGTLATINVASGATFGTPGTNGVTNIGALNGAGTVVTWGTPLIVGSGSNLNSSFSGVIVDGQFSGGSLFKSGGGTMTLTGPNTYTGGTTVNSGRLVLGNGGALGSGTIQVNANGIFQPAVGTSAGSTTSGTLGASFYLNGGLFDMASDGVPGVFTLNQQTTFSGTSLTLGGGTLAFGLGNGGGTPVDQLFVTRGSAAVTGTNDISIALPSGGTLAYNTYPLIELNGSGASGLTNSNFTLLGSSNGTSEIVSVGTNRYMLTLVNSSTAESLVVGPGFTNSSFTLSASAAAHTIITGGTSSIAVTLANIGGTALPDTIVYNGLSASTGAGGTITGSSGTGSVAPSNSGSYAATFSSGTTGSYTISPTYLSVTGSNGTTPAFTPPAATDTVNVLAHSSPTLTIASGSGQSVIVGASNITASLTLNNPGANVSPLDVNGLSSNLSGGPTGSGVVSAGNSASYTAALNTSTTGVLTQSASLSAGDQQSLSGASALNSLSQGIALTVYGHAVPVYSPTTLDLGNVHVGYAAQMSAGSIGVTNGVGGDLRANLNGSGAGINNVSLTSLSGVAPGSTGPIQAQLATGITTAKVLDQNVTYTFGDASTMLGASTNVGQATIAVTGQVYSGLMVWSGSNGTSWGVNGNWNDSTNPLVHVAPGGDAKFQASDSATFDGLASSAGTITLDNAAPSLSAINFSNSNASYTIAQGFGGTLTLNGSNSVLGMATVAISGTQTISAPILLSSSAAFVPDDSGQLILANNIGENTPGMALVLAASGALQAGSLILSGTNNSYTGGTYVESGTLYVNNTGAIQDGSSLIVGAGGTFIYDPTAGGAANAPAVTEKASDRSLAPVPEPGTLALLSVAGIVAATAVWRRRRK